jgi:hypothetical protein
MARLFLWCLVVFAIVSAAACSSKAVSSNGLMVILSTDMKTPDDFDTMRVEVSEQASGTWQTLLSSDFVIPGETRLPTTLAIAAGSSANEEVLLRILALSHGRPRVLREAQLQVPSDRVAELRLVLARVCDGQVKIVSDAADPDSSCASGESCQPSTGACGSNLVDSATLPTYTPGDENEDAGASASAPMDACACDAGRSEASVGDHENGEPGGDANPSASPDANAAADANTNANANADGGDGGCGPGMLVCGGQCVANDIHNCGVCGHDCSVLNHVLGTPSCLTSGACSFPSSACSPGWMHCSGNPDDGCEVDITKATSCGSCTTMCGAGTVCAPGTGAYSCVNTCPLDAPMLCTSEQKCVNTTTAASDCGLCGMVCTTAITHAQPSCAASKCGFTCTSSYQLCNGGCANYATDDANCSGCGMACTGGKHCTNSACGCTGATHDCSGTCVSNTAVATCGSMCSACPVPAANGSSTCNGTSCGIQCATNYSACGTSCVDEQTDANHCGGCTTVCRYGLCQSAVCAASFFGTGNTEAGPTTVTIGASMLAGSSVTSGATSSLVAVGVQTIEAGTKMRLGVYSDNAGKPGTLLAQTAELTTVANAATEGALPSTAVTAGTRYWIMVLTNATIDLGAETATVTWYYTSSTTYGPLPSNPTTMSTTLNLGDLYLVTAP